MSTYPHLYRLVHGLGPVGGPVSRLLLLTIASHADAHGFCNVPLGVLLAEAEMTESKLMAVSGGLIKGGWMFSSRDAYQLCLSKMKAHQREARSAGKVGAE